METQIVKASAGLDLFNPATMEMALKATEMFTKSNLVPEMYREGGVIKKAKIDYKTGQELEPAVTVSAEQAKANVFIALDLANRLKANPLMVMQNLYIVEGHPSWSSSFLISTINTCGRFRPLKFKLAVEKNPDGTPQMVQPMDKNGHPTGQPIVNVSCVAYTCEKGEPEDKEHMLTSTKITLQMAILEGWMSKNGSKWQTMTEQMLRYRAAAFWVRTYAPELANGMYTTEEVKDFAADADYEEVPSAQPSTAANAGVMIGFETDAEAESAQSETVRTEQGAAPEAQRTEQVDEEVETTDGPGF